MEKEKIKVSPEVSTFSSEDNKTLVMEIPIPGVDKKEIELKMLDNSFTLIAPREDLVFAVAMSLCCPVRAAETKAEYNDGLLRIEAPYKDFMENAVTVKVA